MNSDSCKRYVVQSMQTNSDWCNTFQFTIGDPPVPQDISDWTLKGECRRTTLPNTYLDLAPRVDLGVDTSTLTITLSKDDTLFLGVGRIVFELLRVLPSPQRPILRFYINNILGVVDG
jgi:hypothetical protein